VPELGPTAVRGPDRLERPRGGEADARAPERTDLRADCDRCFGLCCVVPAFSASADFAIDKDAGDPCPNLQPDFRCGIHAGLRERGFPGCAVYDCFGAGQKVAQLTFGGQDWRRRPGVATQMFGVFRIMRQLHELLWLIDQALALSRARPLHRELSLALEETERLTRRSPAALGDLDMPGYRRQVSALLRRASELARAGLAGADLAGAELIGRNLRGAGLRGASLRGATLIGADLTGADLSGADLTGADLRGADLTGADLTGTIFLTQSQLEAARGGAATRLSPPLTRPLHWAPPDGRSQRASAESGGSPGRAGPNPGETTD
jgi:uncharacterized protein YjbI with pentapeptide repeats